MRGFDDDGMSRTELGDTFFDVLLSLLSLILSFTDSAASLQLGIFTMPAFVGHGSRCAHLPAQFICVAQRGRIKSVGKGGKRMLSPPPSLSSSTVTLFTLSFIRSLSLLTHARVRASRKVELR